MIVQYLEHHDKVINVINSITNPSQIIAADNYIKLFCKLYGRVHFRKFTELLYDKSCVLQREEQTDARTIR